MTIVDIHCHTFNADDLPVKGFVAAIAGQRIHLASALGWALAKITQGMADGPAELRALDRLIKLGPGFESAGPSALDEADDAADALLDELTDEDQALAEEAAEEAATDPGSRDRGGQERLGDRLDELRRYLKWVALFGQSRWSLTKALLGLYPEVDLFTPLLVDFQGLSDRPLTATLDQFALQERISRLSMLGHTRAAVHPFAGFDPRRVGALQLVQRAVTEFGFVGVKLYPPVGYLPLGNVDHRPELMSAEDALGVEDALERLYTWCEREQVPITAHCNPSNNTLPSFKANSGPTYWAQVLQSWPALHLNLGHFGWAGDGWSEEIAALMADRTQLYADIGNHELSWLPATMNRLAAIFEAPATATARERFMFGTDWYMLANHHRYPAFLIEVRAAYAERFPDYLDNFLGGTALRFLGFDDPANANNRRLRARYADVGADLPDWLAAPAG